jgi:hypothetical protein
MEGWKVSISPELIGPLLSFFGSIVVAVVTASLTVRLALRRFYAEKWWERKSAAYAAIIEALHHVRNHADTNLAFEMRGREVPEQGDRLLTERLQDGMAELRKQLDMGSFVISDRAVALVSKLMQELEASTHTTQWVEHLELRLSALDSCLIEMRNAARADLQIR